MFFSHRRILSLPVSPGSLSFQSSRKGTPTYSLFPHLFIVAREDFYMALDMRVAVNKTIVDLRREISKNTSDLATLKSELVRYQKVQGILSSQSGAARI